ncbi:MAG: 4-(cytidine 5'-diphospho)-2-C-methyl-D-erythritol kinase [Proteobacteria bacterium SW_6_67_9]|nr:MAG: 4-(cytidine 5'-diphospho)-2-C-methyl-D-erythritol kinase [Proteobacteria bacterium SW_6_67_9]
MWSCGWPAPAKVNLFLHVTGRRDDGYHTVQTLFQFLDCGDALAFRLRDDGVIHRRFGAHEVAADDDLAVRAARTLQQDCDVAHGVDIAVTKHVPAGGGLGGGSSDAATTLAALNNLWECGLSTAALARLGATLGADVPVFLHGHAAWGEGVGDELTPFEAREACYLVVVPATEVPTGRVFADPELTRDHPLITIRDFLTGGAGNDCLPVVRARYPEVGRVLDWLASLGVTPRLSGTGACVFAAFADEGAARAARQRLPSEWGGLVAHGRNRSALATRLDADEAA